MPVEGSSGLRQRKQDPRGSAGSVAMEASNNKAVAFCCGSPRSQGRAHPDKEPARPHQLARCPAPGPGRLRRLRTENRDPAFGDGDRDLERSGRPGAAPSAPDRDRPAVSKSARRAETPAQGHAQRPAGSPPRAACPHAQLRHWQLRRAAGGRIHFHIGTGGSAGVCGAVVGRPDRPPERAPELHGDGCLSSALAVGGRGVSICGRLQLARARRLVRRGGSAGRGRRGCAGVPLHAALCGRVATLRNRIECPRPRVEYPRVSP
jgi:hypothetical protein